MVSNVMLDSFFFSLVDVSYVVCWVTFLCHCFSHLGKLWDLWVAIPIQSSIESL